jgi:hypothetical protein
MSSWAFLFPFLLSPHHHILNAVLAIRGQSEISGFLNSQLQPKAEKSMHLVSLVVTTQMRQDTA